MAISVTAQSRPAKFRRAVVLCCDGRYLPYAALTIDTLRRNNPDPDFDICVTSLDPLELPPVLQRADVRFCQIAVGDAFDGLPTSERFSVAAYLRLALPTAFAADYDKVVYLDCDIFVVGTAVASIFDLDLGHAPVGAISDNMKWKYPAKPTPDQAGLGLNGPYFNSGVLLIDCRAFRDQQVLGACVRIAGEHDPAKLHFDQTLLNLALKDNWACLHPAWNWQWAIVRPMFETYVDVQFVHFVTSKKPWADTQAELPARYRETARRFLAQHFPDVPFSNAKPTITKKALFARLIRHIGKIGVFTRLMQRHGNDIMRVTKP